MPKIAVMEGPGRPMQVREVPRPRLEPGTILLETIFSEVCGTDVHLHHGRLSGVPYPIIPGHVTIGRVAETGGTILDLEGRPLRAGETITFLDVHKTCGNCWFCLVAHATTRCPHRKVYGITYGLSDGLVGGWGDLVELKPGTKIVRIPEGLPPERFIAAGCGLPTSIHAMDRAQIRLGDSVAIQGSGPVGLNALILAQLSGAGHVIMLGGPQTRLDIARRFGADELIPVIGTSPAERVQRVQELTGGRGADVTIEATGVPSAVREGMQMTRDAGRLVVVGQYTDGGETAFSPHQDLNRKHLEIRGCWGSDYSHFERAVRVLARHGDRFRWEAMISRRYGLHELNDALVHVERGEVVKA
ncbi:MAG TPA: zinc-binding dehydrogenase, partial [Planctomycetota bacterium]|nr:zinc-binding dehydrogenase [Planctomycetota bacterium]